MRHTLVVALLAVSAQAQIVTNYYKAPENIRVVNGTQYDSEKSVRWVSITVRVESLSNDVAQVTLLQAVTKALPPDPLVSIGNFLGAGPWTTSYKIVGYRDLGPAVVLHCPKEWALGTQTVIRVMPVSKRPEGMITYDRGKTAMIARAEKAP